jgi:hypothetical protein
MKKIIITEDEKYNILKMYNLLSEDIKRPLQKLMECKFTTDGKYVIYEGKAFLISNGEQVPINEEWSLSDILHTGADILSMGLDFVIPGSGAVVDVLNAVSYIIEGQFKGEKERDSLYLMAVITFGFVLLPGPLQAIAIPLKRAIKTGAGMTSKVVIDGLKIIGDSLNTLLVGIPSQVNSALKSPLAKNIMGKWSTKISGFIDNFTTRIKQLLSKLTNKVKPPLSKIDYTKKLEEFIPPNYLTNPKEVSELTSNLKKLGNEVEIIKSNYIKKYGEREYKSLMQKYLYGGIDKKTLISKLKNVKNPNIRVKSPMGGGADHRIFNSTNPKLVYKAEIRPGEVDKWYDLFSKNPDVFPKVGKKVKVKDDSGKMLDAVVMERLDTSKFMNFWDDMEKNLFQIQKKLPHNEQISLEYLLKNFKKNESVKKQFNIFKKQTKPSSDTNNFFKLVDRLYEISPNPDIRKFNFGYDSNGLLKSLDI